MRTMIHEWRETKAMKMKQISACLCAMVLFGCSRAPLDVRDYISWVEDAANGIRVEETIGDYSFLLQYKPHEYISLMEHRKGEISARELNETVAEIQDLQYYNFRIGSNSGKALLSSGIQAENEYYSRLNYFVSHAQHDIYLVEAQDTLPCSLYLFERNYGLAGHNNIVLGFKRSYRASDKLFVYEDQVLGTGPVKLKIEKESLANIPPLKTN